MTYTVQAQLEEEDENDVEDIRKDLRKDGINMEFIEVELSLLLLSVNVSLSSVWLYLSLSDYIFITL